MLVLIRYPGDSVRIGENISVKVLRLGSRRIKLGISAPEEIRIERVDASPEERRRYETDVPSHRPFRVLVVEDTPTHANLIKQALQKFGISHVVVAGTGEEALRFLERARDRCDFEPDLVLLDLGLPGVSGLEVLRLMRSVHEFRNTPVVILTCSTSESEVSRCIKAGANGFVCKSEDYNELRVSVRRIADFWQHGRKVG